MSVCTWACACTFAFTKINNAALPNQSLLPSILLYCHFFLSNLFLVFFLSSCFFVSSLLPVCLAPSIPVFTSLVFRPAPEITWVKKNGELLESRAKIEKFGRSLRLINITERDSGEYQCIAQNTQGKAIHTYSLTVEGTLSFICTHKYTETTLKIHFI